MRILDLPHGWLTTIDEEDWPAVEGLTLYRGQTGYVYYSFWERGKHFTKTLHRLIMGFPTDAHVDHINGDTLDNRRSNLRVVTYQINQVNRKALNKNNTSGRRGVTRRGDRWIAQIMVNHRTIHLGMYDGLTEAAQARRAAELEHYGEACP